MKLLGSVDNEDGKELKGQYLLHKPWAPDKLRILSLSKLSISDTKRSRDVFVSGVVDAESHRRVENESSVLTRRKASWHIYPWPGVGSEVCVRTRESRREAWFSNSKKEKFPKCGVDADVDDGRVVGVTRLALTSVVSERDNVFEMYLQYVGI
jgi:hypothetical protein